MIRRALISVWNKEGIIELASFLTDNNVEIISTGGTKKALEENNIKVTSISEITGMDSVMDGRVKTLNPKIFGSILADRGNSNHLEDLDMIGGSQIDVVVVNFYPFEENAVKKNLNLEDLKNELVLTEKTKILNMYSMSHYENLKRSMTLRFFNE